MAGWIDAVIVSLIAIGASVLVGLLGYFADKSGDPEENAEEAAISSARKGARYK